MSRTEALIDEISHLPADQMQRVYQALTRQLHRQSTTEQLLARVSGLAAGLWATDAQAYVTALRQDTRPRHPLSKPTQQLTEFGW